jgi:hypothetical protein
MMDGIMNSKGMAMKPKRSSLKNCLKWWKLGKAYTAMNAITNPNGIMNLR